MTKVVITGGKGFVGRRMTRGLQSAGHEVVPVDRDDCDLSDPASAYAVMEEHRPDVVIHLAGSIRRGGRRSEIGRPARTLAAR